MSDEEEEEVARAFRPGRRPGWIAAGLNGVLAVLLLGVPYVRGRMRASDAGAHYAALAQCMYGGRAVDAPGLALPPGDREAFAARVARAAPDWPGPCIDELRAMRPEPVIFLFPSPKQAEEDLRRAIDQAEAELVALQRARSADEGGVGAVPERPLRALTQLRAALANLFDAADVAVDPQAPAIALDEDPTIVAPSRIPLRTASSGALAVRPEPGGLRAIASDGRSVAEAGVHGGRVDLVQVRRPPAVRGIALGPEGGFLLWITSETTCSSDPQRCAGRLLGVAPMRDVAEPTPRWWLAAHPAGRIDRAVAVEPGALRVIAVGEDGRGREARRFELDPDAPEPAGEDDVAPIVASERVALGDALDALLVPGGVVRAWRDSGALWIEGAGIDPALEVPLPGEGEARRAPRQVALARCGTWTAVAMPDGLVVLDGARALAPITQPLREPVLGASRADDVVRVACHDAGADVVAIDRRRRVLRWACGAEGCGEAQVVAQGASQVDAAHGGGTTLVAWTGSEQRPQIRVARLRGPVVGAPEVPAPCWAAADGGMGEGFCGAPAVVAEGDRVLIVARDHGGMGDLLALELAADGFRRLPGL